MPLKDLPLDARPREKLLARGPGALSDLAQLLPHNWQPAGHIAEPATLPEATHT